MTVTQSEFSDFHGKAYAGAIADTTSAVLESRFVLNGEITSGQLVTLGAGDGSTVQPITADTDAGFGIVVRENSMTGDGFSVGAAARIMTSGHIWVTASADVTVAGSQANYDWDGANAGQWTPGAGGISMPNASFEHTCSAGDLVRVRIAWETK